ncbi:YecA family protein [Thioalkalivibrio nitratireducens DSM 14787]|uniref:YecA family protein n=1 Tax=Thioalkalivibrio nitratireducens (strain DSM 14787 / UNIQEM 213 / ALEN2) TaxID=1255043 RepID=L0DV25_THIND|nr:UPF0149 family protein [Thioalkalivibrio nitratireducens]AGA32845.1 YecA family protein [Thioalkalivibrio nitratireducens DSM 14787]
MTNPTAGLSDDELDELDAFFMSHAVPEAAMDLAMLDGYLTAIALNPELIPPSVWLPWVWDMDAGNDDPAFNDRAQAEWILGLVMRHYNHVLTMVSAGFPEPIFGQPIAAQGGSFTIVEEWAEGFVFGMSTFADPWWTQLQEQAPDLLAPILLHGTDEGLETLEEFTEETEALLRDAPDQIVESVQQLQDYFAPFQKQLAEQRTKSVRRAGPKIGRNDPCPCGSGKKYKKCCGATPDPA